MYLIKHFLWWWLIFGKLTPKQNTLLSRNTRSTCREMKLSTITSTYPLLQELEFVNIAFWPLIFQIRIIHDINYSFRWCALLWHHKFKDFSCIGVQTDIQRKLFKRANDTLIVFRRLIKYERTWINYRIDMACGRCSSFRGKNAKYGDWEPGTNQGNIWKMKQTSSLLIRTRTQGLLWRNHWNHHLGLARVEMTTRIKGLRETLHNKSVLRELGEPWHPFFRTTNFQDHLGSPSRCTANGSSQIPAFSSHIQTSVIWTTEISTWGIHMLSLFLYIFFLPGISFPRPFRLRSLKTSHTKLWCMMSMLPELHWD